MEHGAGRRAAGRRGTRRAPRFEGPRAPGAPHVGGPARRDAREQLRLPVAEARSAGRDRARPSRLSVCVGRRRSAPRLRHGNHAVREEHLRRGPQRRRPHDGGPHLRERALGAALRDPQRERRSLPTRAAHRYHALGAAREGRNFDGRGLPEPHVAGAARRLHPRGHSGLAAADAARERSDVAGRRCHEQNLPHRARADDGT